MTIERFGVAHFFAQHQNAQSSTW